MPKKMIMLSNLDLWSLGEGEGAPSFYNTVDAYVRSGWDITLIQPFSKYREDYKLEGCRMIKFNNTIFDFFNKIPKLRFLMKFLAAQYMNYMFVKKAEEIIKKDSEKHIIYSYEVYAVKAGYKLSKKYNFPFVTRFQGTIMHGIQNNMLTRIRKYPHFSALEQKSDLVIMTDDGTKGNEVLNKLKNESEKIMFLKNGQNPIISEDLVAQARNDIRNNLKVSDDCLLLLTVSRLKNWKRVDRAINVLKEIIDKNINSELIIVGMGEEYENLRNLTIKLGLEKKVHFVGSIKQTDVWKYYGASDIFLSLYDISNLGNPLMEAMKYGKCIITLDNGDTNKIIRNNVNGILLAEKDICNISNEIIKLLNDNAKMIALGKKAQEYAENNLWSWEKRMRTEVVEVDGLLK